MPINKNNVYLHSSPPTMFYTVLLIVICLKGLSMQALKKQDIFNNCSIYFILVTNLHILSPLLDKLLRCFHKSSFILRTSQLWNTLPSPLSAKPATYHPSNLASTNLIFSLYPLNLSPFSKFFLCRGHCYRL